MRSAILSAAAFLSAGAFALGASNIDASLKYAWGENVGWLNWRDANGGSQGAEIRATCLSGFVWAENVGFINLGDGSPANGSRYGNTDGSDTGVNIDANGDLYGYAWGENIGWVNFDTRAKGAQRARVDSAARRLRGYVWGENIGWINLDDAGNYVAFGTTVAADVDGDSDVDLTDFTAFQRCFNGPNQPPAQANCAGADSDGDSDVDLTDFTAFQRCFNGPNQPPTC